MASRLPSVKRAGQQQAYLESHREVRESLKRCKEILAGERERSGYRKQAEGRMLKKSRQRAKSLYE